MVEGIFHDFVSLAPDGADATKFRPSDHNAPHRVTSYVDVYDRDYGALGNDSNDDLGPIVAASAAAKLAGKGVCLPAGVFRHSEEMTIDGVVVFGHGKDSVLKATDEAGAIILTGLAPAIRDVAIETTVAILSQANNACGILVSAASRFGIDGVHILSAAAAGILLDDSDHGRIHGNFITETLADGIHETNGSHHNSIGGNTIEASGDDGIAVVSYVADGVQCHHTTIFGNTVNGTVTRGRGISVIGGRKIAIVGNTVDDVADAGIIVYSDGSYSAYGSEDVTIIGNQLEGTSTGAHSNAAIHIEGRSGNLIDGIEIIGNQIREANYGGIYIGPYVEDVHIDRNRLRDILNQAGIYVLGARDVDILYNRIRDADGYGIYVDDAATGTIRISGNTLRDINRLSTAGVDAIHVETGSAADRIVLLDNSHSNPGGYTVERLIECVNPNVVAGLNHSTAGLLTVLGDNPRWVHNGDSTRPREAYGFGAAPTTGTWAVGDRVYNTAPAAAGNIGWVCTTAGTPGTWKTFGAIAA